MTEAEALERIREARRLLNDAYGAICQSGRASEFARELNEIQNAEDVLWQYTTNPKYQPAGGRA